MISLSACTTALTCSLSRYELSIAPQFLVNSLDYYTTTAATANYYHTTTN